MSPRELLSASRNHWRVTILTVLIVLSLFVLFAPLEGLQPSDAADVDDEDQLVEQAEMDRGITNLQWGLQLSGGTSVRAPIHGFIAEDLDFDPGDEGDIAVEMADVLDISEGDVTARAGGAGESSVEVTEQNVTREEFISALDTVGLAVDEDDVREGVHSDTRDSVRNVIQNRIDEVGLGGAEVDILTRPTGERLIAIDVPNIGQEQLIDLITERGQVEIWAHYPDADGEYQNETVLSQEQIASVDPADPGEGAQAPHVPVRVASEHAPQFNDDMNEYGFGTATGTTCNWVDHDEWPDDPGHCLVTVVDGEVVYASRVSPGLGASWESEDWVNDPIFIMETSEYSDAQELAVNLQAGALPADLNIDAGTVFFLEPSMADEFRFLSLIVGLFAALAVAGMVYWRYRDVRVAAPMLLTASSEVIILLAIAVIVPIPLDLAHIAGFIAVLGTGVDDLVIIADEIMQRGDIRTDRVFENRFRKAFWVIGVAAATTILAMTPLVALSLGELTGFAIVTIIGVIIGVTITRPAYGNILRILMLD